ncbi:MAG: PqiC family protein [Burkholderiales bacterium]
MRPTRWLFLAWFAALAGCASAPPVNYALSRPVPQGAATLPAVKSGPYALGEVIVPPEVDHAELAVQQTDGRILLLANDLWSAPLGGQLRTALALELTTQLGMPPVQSLTPGMRDPEVSVVQVDVQRFDLVPGQQVTLEALWRVRFAGSKKLVTCFVRLQEPVGVGVSALVLGQQKNIQQLATLIAETLSGQGKPKGANCTAPQ